MLLVAHYVIPLELGILSSTHSSKHATTSTKGFAMCYEASFIRTSNPENGSMPVYVVPPRGHAMGGDPNPGQVSRYPVLVLTLWLLTYTPFQTRSSLILHAI